MQLPYWSMIWVHLRLGLGGIGISHPKAIQNALCKCTLVQSKPISEKFELNGKIGWSIWKCKSTMQFWKEVINTQIEHQNLPTSFITVSKDPLVVHLDMPHFLRYLSIL